MTKVLNEIFASARFASPTRMTQEWADRRASRDRREARRSALHDGHDLRTARQWRAGPAARTR